MRVFLIAVLVAALLPAVGGVQRGPQRPPAPKAAAAASTPLLWVEVRKAGHGTTSHGRPAPRPLPRANRSRSLFQPAWQRWALSPRVQRLVQCESTGRLHAVSPTGKYRGLYQSTASWATGTWEQQSRGAYRLWRQQGWGAWPVCGSA